MTTDTTQPDQDKRIALRLDPDLHKRFEQHAQRNERTVGQELRFLIKQALDEAVQQPA